MTSPIVLRGPHETRPIRFLDLHEDEGRRIKMYGISARGERPGSQLAEAARALAVERMPAAGAADGGSVCHGIGFTVIHEAADFAYVLVDWWASENELHQRLFSAELARPTALASHPSPAVGCVWELAVVDFERRAWLRHVLTNPDGPNLEAYLDARTDDDV